MCGDARTLFNSTCDGQAHDDQCCDSSSPACLFSDFLICFACLWTQCASLVAASFYFGFETVLSWFVFRKVAFSRVYSYCIFYLSSYFVTRLLTRLLYSRLFVLLVLKKTAKLGQVCLWQKSCLCIVAFLKTIIGLFFYIKSSLY